MHAGVTRSALAVAALALVALDARVAVASPSAKLVFVRGPGAEACPPEADLRRSIASRLGYDPFFLAASKTVVAEISRASNGYRGRVQIVGEDGNLRGERVLATRGDDCRELTSAMGLAISLALDDLDEPKTPVVPAPEPPAAPLEPVSSAPDPSPVAEEPLRPPAPVAQPPRVEIAASAGPSVALGSGPDGTYGGELGLSLRLPRFAVRLDARAELPSSKPIASASGGEVSTHAFFALASVCPRFGAFFGCVGGGAKLVWSRTTRILHPARDFAAVPALGLRLGAVLDLAPHVFLEPSFELGTSFLRPNVEVDASSVYETAPLWASFALRFGARFP